MGKATIAKVRATKERQKTPVEKANSALEARRDQIDKVYNSKEYKEYLKQIPKQKRSSRDPRTPDKHDKMPSGEWNTKVREWQQKNSKDLRQHHSHVEKIERTQRAVAKPAARSKDDAGNPTLPILRPEGKLYPRSQVQIFTCAADEMKLSSCDTSNLRVPQCSCHKQTILLNSSRSLFDPPDYAHVILLCMRTLELPHE